MRKRKDSHDGSPVGDTNILFVPDSSADPPAPPGPAPSPDLRRIWWHRWTVKYDDQRR